MTAFNPFKIRAAPQSIPMPAFAEIKYDGMLVKISVYNNQWSSITKNGVIYTAKKAEHTNIADGVFWGELIYGSGFAGSLYQITRCGVNLGFKIFDIESYNSNIVSDLQLIERKELLASIFEEDQQMLAEMEVVESWHDSEEYMQFAVNRGYEGIVLKPFTGVLKSGPIAWAKMKEKDTNGFIVHSIDPVKERIEIEWMTPEGHKAFTGVKVDTINKKNLLVGMAVAIEHQGILPSGSLRHPVFKGIYTENTETKTIEEVVV